MLYSVFLPEFFKRIVKDLEKKYPSVKADLGTALRVVENNPELGKSFQGWGDVKKVRVHKSDVTAKELRMLLGRLDQELID